MDPLANLEEATFIAREIVSDDFDEAAPGKRTQAMQDLLTRVDRLAELVLALHEWRSNGGFDPYADPNAPVADPQANALLRRVKVNKISRVFTPPGAGLPDDYILLIENVSGPGFECGIAPDGSVSS